MVQTKMERGVDPTRWTTRVPQKRKSLVEMAMVQTKMEMVMYPIILTTMVPQKRQSLVKMVMDLMEMAMVQTKMAMDPMEMVMDPMEMAMVPLVMEMDQMEMEMGQMETEMDPTDCVVRSHVKSVSQSGSQYARITHLQAAKKFQPKFPPQSQLRSASRSPPKCAEM